ncbi:MAG: rRNA pseudouridine synthase [Acidimicrobiia bacterium]|nr:rRNA pseudouridine synthase [Acidimicrobiia bacterium]MYC58433.1 rRNA pseudouridine synthase [Acidimicrobiia bacterium]MYG94192.1 rRNA pseudouridine synthase [Acidimicrobiia bacterium]MYI30461.1 rRNA pseudouridine synthase [Acidimicrobiia bacterium]
MQKVLAAAGVASRRAVEELVEQGRIDVNGKPARLGQRVDPNTDTVAVDDQIVGLHNDLVHYLLNKPVGVISSADDPQDRLTVVEMVPRQPRVFPVGRLDADSEGLLILTNNGALAQKLTHPSFGVAKEYWVLVKGNPSRGVLRQLREGVELEDGLARAVAISLPQTSTIRIVVNEGRNRLVRRMCDAVGHPVKRLVRTRIGPIADRKLHPGAWRGLAQAEVRQLEGLGKPDCNSGT